MKTYGSSPVRVNLCDRLNSVGIVVFDCVSSLWAIPLPFKVSCDSGITTWSKMKFMALTMTWISPSRLEVIRGKSKALSWGRLFVDWSKAMIILSFDRTCYRISQEVLTSSSSVPSVRQPVESPPRNCDEWLAFTIKFLSYFNLMTYLHTAATSTAQFLPVGNIARRSNYPIRTCCAETTVIL